MKIKKIHILPEPTRSTPTESDICIYESNGSPALQALQAFSESKRIASANTWDDLEESLRIWMNLNMYYSDVYFISDHGNAHLIQIPVSS